MGSVIVTWGGTCPVPELQVDLLGHLERVARLSQRCFTEPSILDFDRPITGRILVSAGLFDAPAEGEHLIALGNRATPASSIRLSGSRPPPAVPELYEVVDSELSLRGIDFRLYNPFYYTNEDRVSFVFATLEGCRELSNRVVAVHDRAVCETIEDDVMRDVDWFLTRPSIHLRREGEQWIDLFLGTVKCYFMPELWWWHYGYQPGYAALSRALSKQRRETFGGDEARAAEAAFAVVEDALRAEFVKWGAPGGLQDRH
jgi:hypothetical protein